MCGFMTTRSYRNSKMAFQSHRDSKTGRSTKRHIPPALVAGVTIAFVVLAATVFANTASTSQQYSSMTGMMSEPVLNQSNAAECNQMMIGYGLNQTSVVDMDQIMSGGMMGTMSNNMVQMMH